MLLRLLLAAEEGGTSGTGTGSGTTAGNGGNSLGMTIMLIVLVVAIIALFVWQSISGKKKQKEAQERVNKLKKGDRVKTIGGVCGFVHEINDAENTFVLETGSGEDKSYVKFDKAAIYQTAPAEGYANVPANAEPVKEEKAEEKTEEVKTESVEESAPAEEAKTEEKSKEERRKDIECI